MNSSDSKSDNSDNSDDVSLLKTIVHHMQRYNPHVHRRTEHGMRYASVAIILRMKPLKDSTSSGEEMQDVYDSRSFLRHIDRESLIIPFRLEMMYMLRQTRSTDPWSGHVAFPGGKREEDKDGNSALLTAMRETREEVGIDLESDRYQFLGRLDDLMVGFNTKMIVSPQVFLQLTLQDDPVTLQESEVQSVRWVSVRWIAMQLSKLARNIPGTHCGKITMRLNRVIPVLSHALSDEFNDRLGLVVKFPNLYLHEYDHFHHRKEDYMLWGMTLKFTVKFLLASNTFPQLGLEESIRTRTLKKLNGYTPNNVLINIILQGPMRGWYNDRDPFIIRRWITVVIGLFGLFLGALYVTVPKYMQLAAKM